MASVRSVPETAGNALFHQLFMSDETFGAIAEELAASAPGLIRLSEIGVTFDDDARETATVKCAALATGSVQNGGDFGERRLISAKMIRESDGKWRFRSLRAEPVDTGD